jgi:hypothetical protein
VPLPPSEVFSPPQREAAVVMVKGVVVEEVGE